MKTRSMTREVARPTVSPLSALSPLTPAKPVKISSPASKKATKSKAKKPARKRLLWKTMGLSKVVRVAAKMGVATYTLTDEELNPPPVEPTGLHCRLRLPPPAARPPSRILQYPLWLRDGVRVAEESFLRSKARRRAGELGLAAEVPWFVTSKYGGVMKRKRKWAVQGRV